jgi:hypothetical protein
MPDFPRLRTGAIAQHPFRSAIRYSTDVLRFVDGSEQRFRSAPNGLREWTLDLSLLDEGELNAFREWFEDHTTAGLFTFRDPIEDVDYPNCRFEREELQIELDGELRGASKITIRETRP